MPGGRGGMQMGGMGGMHPGQQHGMGQQMMGMNAKHPQQVCVGEGVGVGVGVFFFCLASYGGDGQAKRARVYGGSVRRKLLLMVGSNKIESCTFLF